MSEKVADVLWEMLASAGVKRCYGIVGDALAEALAHEDGPVVVDAMVDPFALSLPAHVPFHAAKDFTLSIAKHYSPVAWTRSSRPWNGTFVWFESRTGRKSGKGNHCHRGAG